jgi:ABC-type transport system involved in multi-copper enzyme maturation permease subunit
LLPYGALTFLLAVASRSTVVAISGGLAYVLLIENILEQVIGLLEEPISQIMGFLPGSMARSLLTLNQASGGIASSIEAGSMSPMNAAIGIAAWTLFFLGLSLFIFNRQDLSE